MAECPVCLLEYDVDVRPATLCCGHSYCVKCILNLMGNRRSRCPVCQKPILHDFVPSVSFNFEGSFKSPTYRDSASIYENASLRARILQLEQRIAVPPLPPPPPYPLLLIPPPPPPAQTSRPLLLLPPPPPPPPAQKSCASNSVRRGQRHRPY